MNFQFWRVDTKEEAVYVIKQCSYVFLFVAGLNILLGFIIGIAGLIIDGGIFFVLGFLLLFLKSRIMAVLLLLFSGAGVVYAFLSKIGVTYGGSNILPAAIVFWFAIASVYVTFRYRKLE